VEESQQPQQQHAFPLGTQRQDVQQQDEQMHDASDIPASIKVVNHPNDWHIGANLLPIQSSVDTDLPIPLALESSNAGNATLEPRLNAVPSRAGRAFKAHKRNVTTNDPKPSKSTRAKARAEVISTRRIESNEINDKKRRLENLRRSNRFSDMNQMKQLDEQINKLQIIDLESKIRNLEGSKSRKDRANVQEYRHRLNSLTRLNDDNGANRTSNMFAKLGEQKKAEPPMNQ